MDSAFRPDCPHTLSRIMAALIPVPGSPSRAYFGARPTHLAAHTLIYPVLPPHHSLSASSRVHQLARSPSCAILCSFVILVSCSSLLATNRSVPLHRPYQHTPFGSSSNRPTAHRALRPGSTYNQPHHPRTDSKRLYPFCHQSLLEASLSTAPTRPVQCLAFQAPINSSTTIRTH